MTYDQLIKYYGTQQNIADALGIWQTAVSQWAREGVPYGRQCEIQLLTNGELMAEKPIKAG